MQFRAILLCQICCWPTQTALATKDAWGCVFQPRCAPATLDAVPHTLAQDDIDIYIGKHLVASHKWAHLDDWTISQAILNHSPANIWRAHCKSAFAHGTTFLEAIIGTSSFQQGLLHNKLTLHQSSSSSSSAVHMFVTSLPKFWLWYLILKLFCLGNLCT